MKTKTHIRAGNAARDGKITPAEQTQISVT
jgi:hypothetical protein